VPPKEGIENIAQAAEIRPFESLAEDISAVMPEPS